MGAKKAAERRVDVSQDVLTPGTALPLTSGRSGQCLWQAAGYTWGPDVTPRPDLPPGATTTSSRLPQEVSLFQCPQRDQSGDNRAFSDLKIITYN